MRPWTALLLLSILPACAGTTPSARHRADDPDVAAAWHALKRAGSADVRRSYAEARAAMRKMARYATNGDVLLRPNRAVASEEEQRPFGNWKYLGPGNIGGRTRVLLIDPVEPRIMYAAGVSGGVWKSLSGGERWEPVGDELTNIAVNSMVMHPVDRNVLYAGTGEGYFREEVRGTGLPLRGDGVFVTRDGGESWSRLPSTANEDFHWVNDLVISAHDPSRIYAATRSGVWRSPDAGATWTRVLTTTVKGGCLDLTAVPGSAADRLFASCGTFAQATVYRNDLAEAEGAWTPVLSEPDMGRTTVAVAPSSPSIVYALSATNEPGRKNQGMLAVWRSDQGGDAGTWSARITNDSSDVIGANMLTNLISIEGVHCDNRASEPVQMGWYCNTIAVDPLDPERVWVGGVDLFRSDDGGSTWGVASYWWSEQTNQEAQAPYVHADQHVIAFHPDYDGVANRVVYFGNDGGVFRTDDAHGEVAYGLDALCTRTFSKVRFEALNNSFGVTQFYHGAVFPDGRRVIGGTQDNGTIVGALDEGPDTWQRVIGGDGGYVAVDQRDPLLIYAETQFGNVFRSTDGGATFRSFRTGLSDSFLFVTPLTIDPSVAGTAWIGGNFLWRYVEGAGRWNRASTFIPAPVSAIAVAPDNSNRVLAATNAGHILRSDSALTASGTSNWSSVLPRPGFVSSIAFDPAQTQVVYATYAGFGGEHVWTSLDGGTSWSPLSGALPDIPVHSIAVDPTRSDRLYLGTDLGVFVSVDRGATWAVENSGFANVVTEAVVIGQGANGPAVYAFTHGRGAWRAELTIPGKRRRAVR